MKKISVTLSFLIFLGACASVPQETVELSKTISKDLSELHQTHRTMIQLHYSKIRDNVNDFIDEVYSPYIIHYMLSSDLANYKNGKPSLFKSIEEAGKNETAEATENALFYMEDIVWIIQSQISDKRDSLLNPLAAQEISLLNHIDESYNNVILANNTITNHLKSIRKVKESQREVLATVGLEGADEKVIDGLLVASEKIKEAVEAGKKIDVESDKALEEINKITEKIKEVTNKN